MNVKEIDFDVNDLQSGYYHWKFNKYKYTDKEGYFLTTVWYTKLFSDNIYHRMEVNTSSIVKRNVELLKPDNCYILHFVKNAGLRAVFCTTTQKEMDLII